MERVARFFRVSEARYLEDGGRSGVAEVRLPRRGTSGSAGYDFFAPFGFSLEAGETIVVPTGVRARIREGWVLMLFPRSGQGFRYRVMLYNSVGVIDSDYFEAKNEGHIMVKLINANREGKRLTVNKGDAFVQGVFLPFGLTEDDEAAGVREGGFGSTDGRTE